MPRSPAQLRRTALAAILPWLVAGCVNLTIYVQFPQETVDRAAREDEEKVRGQAKPEARAGEATPDGRQALVMTTLLRIWLETPSASAVPPGALPQQAPKEDPPKKDGDAKSPDKAPETPPPDTKNLRTDTPEIKAIVDRRTERFAKLVPFYDAGNLGESKSGTVVLRDEKGLNLKQKTDLRKMVDAENADRDAWVKEVAKVNKTNEDSVRKGKLKAYRELARIGWWIESDDGKWAKKEPPKKEEPGKAPPKEAPKESGK